MNAQIAKRFAAKLNEAVDRARLNDSAATSEKPHDPAQHDITLIDAVKELDDQARQRLVDAIAHARAAEQG